MRLAASVVLLCASVLKIEAADNTCHHQLKVNNDVTLHFIDRGEGEAVILIHGFCVTAEVNWGRLIAPLAKEFRVIALDCRGHGRSSKPTDPNAYGAEMVTDIARLMDHLKIKRAHIVGYSMGSLIAGKFLAEHPDRVISAVIGGMGWLELTERWRTMLDEVATSLEQGRGPRPFNGFFRQHKEASYGSASVDRVADLMSGLLVNQKALAACVRQFPDFVVTKEELQKCKTPMLAIVGDKDPFMTPVLEMKQFTSNLQVVIVKGGDHLTTVTSPIFSEKILAFLMAHGAAIHSKTHSREAERP